MWNEKMEQETREHWITPWPSRSVTNQMEEKSWTNAETDDNHSEIGSQDLQLTLFAWTLSWIDASHIISMAFCS